MPHRLSSPLRSPPLTLAEPLDLDAVIPGADEPCVVGEDVNCDITPDKREKPHQLKSPSLSKALDGLFEPKSK